MLQRLMDRGVRDATQAVSGANTWPSPYITAEHGIRSHDALIGWLFLGSPYGLAEKHAVMRL